VELATEFLFDAGNFFFEAVRPAVPVIELDGAFDPLAIDGQRFETLLNDLHNL
jgi:hypothetical protein